MVNEEIYGVDYSSTGEVTSFGDIMTVGGLDNAKQAIRNELLTPVGSYPSVDSDYGSEIYEVWGEDLTNVQLQQIEVYVNNALLKQERVDSISEIYPFINKEGTVSVDITVLLVNGSEEEIVLDLED